jgi:HEPN domain-containing protein
MSKINEARAVSYLLDATYDRSAVEFAIKEKLYPVAIFHAQQTCEKATKACLSLMNILITGEHQYMDFVQNDISPNAGDLKPALDRILSDITKVEMYYIPSRYSVDRYGNIHHKAYDERELVMLSRSSIEYLEICFSFVEGRIGYKLPRETGGLEKFFLANYSDHVKGSG